MGFGTLLEKLIEIAMIPKTDFAISVDMTPSALSKILSGKRLPFYKDKKIFTKKAASCLAQEIYKDKCYLKFESVFPVIYNFNISYELEAFLSDAIDYHLTKEYAVENNDNTDYPSKEISILGKKQILNMFCIIISDAISSSSSPLEIFSSVHTLFYRLNSDVLNRIRIIRLRNPQRKITLNHFFDMPFLENAFNIQNMDLFSYIVKAHRHFDLNLWQVENEIYGNFFLLKNNFLLVFNTQIDGTLLMTIIRHKSYLSTFFNTIIKKDARNISYTTDEASALVESDSSTAAIRRLLDNPIDAVYNFTSLGYLVKKEDLMPFPASAAIKDFMLKLFDNVLTKDTTFYVTIEAMTSFFATGKVIVPLIGAVEIERDKRIPYLERFNNYLQKKSHDKIKIITNDPPKVSMISLKGLSILYIVDNEYKNERFHCFETDVINSRLHDAILNDTIKILDFTPDLWSLYIDEMTDNLPY